ncbi:conjugal transfer protein [Alcaligenaceae bacterium CGII-47]|nr:conjugal transfer protein [Alcaligenaceae bacterium CGII-47]
MSFLPSLPDSRLSILTRLRAGIPLITALALAGASRAALAQSTGGLAKAQTTLTIIKDNLLIILPIAAIIIGLIIVVLYMAEIMRKDDMVRWLIGLVVAGSIAEIVALLWK